MPATLFVSYRRSQAAAVDRVCSLLRSHGMAVWVDREAIEELQDFPERIREGLSSSHAVLVWWSRDYADSSYCLEELRLAWQMARQHPAEQGQRIWILNPEPDATHIHAGDLAAQNFLAPPGQSGDTSAWAGSRLAQMAALAEFGPLSTGDHFSNVAPACYGMPTAGRAFVGRGAELWHIHSALFPPRLDAAPELGLVQLHGIAGIGKSALAAHYAQTFAGAYPGGIWWFNLQACPEPSADNPAEVGLAWLSALEHTLGQLAPGLLDEVSRSGEGRALAPAKVRERLARVLSAGAEPKAYLWVIDKLPSVHRRDVRDRMLAFLRAPTAAGRTLVTCRDALPMTHATAICVPPLPAAEGERLLARYLAPAQRQSEHSALTAMVEQLGGHPLALTLVGEHVAASPWGVAPVLEQVRRHGALASVEKIHSALELELGDLAPSVLAAFHVSVAPLGGEARRLLALASVCAPQSAVAVTLLKNAFDRRHGDDPDSGDPAGDAIESGFEAALRVLWRTSLLGLDAHDRQTAMVHPLVAQVMLHALGRQPSREQGAVANALLSRLARLDAEPLAPLELRDDAPHVQALLRGLVGDLLRDPVAGLQVDKASTVDGRTLVRLALGLARLQDGSGHPDHALAAARQAAALATRCLAANDPDHLRARTALSSAMAGAGLLQQAAELQLALLPAVKQVFGEDHEDALVVSNLLAHTRFLQHRFDEAVQLQAALLGAVRARPDSRSTVTLAALSGLAATFVVQGRLAEACELQEEALALANKSTSGPHPEAIIAMHNLAATRLAMGEVGVAVSLQTRALADSEGLFGPSHPTTRLARSTLADVFVGRGDLDSAISLYRRALEDASQALGADHPESLTMLSRLTSATCAQAGATESDALQKRFIATAMSVLPAGHPEALAAVEELAGALNRLERPIGDLAPLLEVVLAARLRDLGEGHLETVHAYSNLALAQSQVGDPATTIELRRGAVRAARALRCDAALRTREIRDAYFPLILLLDAVGQFSMAREAEAELVAELKVFRRSLELH